MKQITILILSWSFFWSANCWAALPAPVQDFLNSMSAEKIALPSRPSIYNNYYKKKNPALKNSPTAIVFIPGMGEAALKYFSIPSALNDNASQVYLWDHIGQGFSSYQLPNDTEKIYIDSFDTHLEALTNFLKELKTKHKNVIIVAHSMGAHLALRTAYKHPELIQKIVVSSPLIALNDTKVPWPVIKWFLGWFNPQGPLPLYSYFKAKAVDIGYVSNDKLKLDIYKETQKEFPQLRKTELTAGWLIAAINSLAEMNKENYTQIKIPILVLQAEEDYLVNNDAQKKFCEQIANCELKKISKSLHEIFFETEDIFREAIMETKKFVSTPQAIK